MNGIDEQYQTLLKTIIENGIVKKDRTGTGTIAIFGYTVRHDMKSGFPLLTTKKMFTKGIIVELIWFLRGETNIKYLVDNDVHIWDGDAYKKYQTEWLKENPPMAGPYTDKMLTIEQFISKIKTDDEFAKRWGELGPVYGKQWRDWNGIDQIKNLINDLKNNPDSRRLMVTAWNPTDVPNQTLPPCHYGFQCYTRDLTIRERVGLAEDDLFDISIAGVSDEHLEKMMSQYPEIDKKVPRKALSLLWNQRSVDTPLGLPFNIASYGFLLEILAKEVNMMPETLIGNLGDTHIYLNQIEDVKQQLDREPYSLPHLDFTSHIFDDGFENMLQKITVNDFKITDYRSHSVIKIKLSN